MTEVAAPGERHSETFAVASVATVRVYETPEMTLKVAKLSTSTGWWATGVSNPGNPVRVLFRDTKRESRHFTARLNAGGTRLITVIVACSN